MQTIECFGGNPNPILSTYTYRASEALTNTPGLAGQVLSPAELASAQNGMFAPNFGKAVEKMVADEITKNATHDSMFQYVGGPGRPDFVGRDLLAGRTFDITTTARSAIRSHLRRPYSNLGIGGYSRPIWLRRFP